MSPPKTYQELTSNKHFKFDDAFFAGIPHQKLSFREEFLGARANPPKKTNNTQNGHLHPLPISGLNPRPKSSTKFGSQYASIDNPPSRSTFYEHQRSSSGAGTSSDQPITGTNSLSVGGFNSHNSSSGKNPYTALAETSDNTQQSSEKPVSWGSLFTHRRSSSS